MNCPLSPDAPQVESPLLRYVATASSSMELLKTPSPVLRRFPLISSMCTGREVEVEVLGIAHFRDPCARMAPASFPAAFGARRQAGHVKVTFHLGRFMTMETRATAGRERLLGLRCVCL
jgi:hypothetical protein